VALKDGSPANEALTAGSAVHNALLPGR